MIPVHLERFFFHFFHFFPLFFPPFFATKVYDAIAAHFSATRYKPWPRVKSFLDGLARGSLVADIGCGNGKYMTDARHFILGADRSRPLALIAAERAAWGGSVCVADATYLPLRSGSFDAAICIAVMHHISTQARRVYVC